MKKLLSLVLVLAVVLSSMSFAFAAPSDIAGNTFESSINKLIGLGILNGYPDGTFKPDSNITRAEFAKIMVTALGYTDAAAAASADAKFTDTASHWAKGPINVASTIGIINGVGNGKFDPDSNVTFEQAVTMIVRALGYEPAAKANGGYPVGYLTIASQEKITKDVTATPNVAVNRATVAKLLDQSLEVEFLIQEGYGTLTTFKKSISINDTIMKKGLKLDKAEGIVIDSYDTTAKTIKFTTDVDKKRQMSYVDPIDPTNTKLCKVNFWYKDGVIYSFENKTTVKFDQISKVNDSDSKTATLTTIADLKSFTLKNDGGLYYSATDNSATPAVTTATLTLKSNDGDVTIGATSTSNYIDTYAKVYVFDNKIYRVEQFSLTNPGVIAEATASKVKYQKYDANDVYLSNIDAASDLLYVFIDGVQKSVSDLKADMFFMSWTASKKVVIAATTGKAEGKLTSYQQDKVTIGGTTYDVTGNNTSKSVLYVSNNNGTNYNKGTVDGLKDKDVVGYKNLVGKLAFIKGTGTDASTDFKAIIKKIKPEAETITVVKDVNGTSTEVDYVVKTGDLVALAGTTGTLSWADVTNNAVISRTGTIVTDANPANRVFKFYLNSDNKITKVERVGLVTLSAATQGTTWAGAFDKFDKDNDSLNNDTAAPGTIRKYVGSAVFFNMSTVDDPKVVYWKDIEGKDKGTVTAANLYVQQKTGTDSLDAVVFSTGYTSVVTTEKLYAYVSGEEMVGDYYMVATPDLSGDSRLKVHKDDVDAGATAVTNDPGDAGKQMDKEFITYVNDGSKILVKSVVTATYGDTTGFTAVENADAESIASEAQGTWVKKDGSDIAVLTGAGTATWYALDPTAKVVRVTIKSDGTGAIDTTLVDDVTSIAQGDNVFVVIVEGKVRGIYYKH